MQQDGWILCLARLYYANLFEIVKKGAMSTILFQKVNQEKQMCFYSGYIWFPENKIWNIVSTTLSTNSLIENVVSKQHTKQSMLMIHFIVVLVSLKFDKLPFFVTKVSKNVAAACVGVKNLHTSRPWLQKTGQFTQNLIIIIISIT